MKYVIYNETLFYRCKGSWGFGCILTLCKAHIKEMAAYSFRSFNIESSYANRIHLSYFRVIWSIMTNTIGIVLAKLNKIVVTIRLKSYIDNITCLLSSTAIGLSNFENQEKLIWTMGQGSLQLQVVGCAVQGTSSLLLQHLKLWFSEECQLVSRH